jgi:hypothetical protein
LADVLAGAFLDAGFFVVGFRVAGFFAVGFFAGDFLTVERFAGGSTAGPREDAPATGSGLPPLSPYRRR